MSPIFLSHFINEHTPAYGGADGLISIKTLSSIDAGSTSNQLRISLPGHIGTHIDFPFHFSNDGRKCGDYPAEFWVFKKVGYLNCTIDQVPAVVGQLPKDIELLILRTGFGQKRSSQEYWSSQPVIPAGFASLFRSHFPDIRVFGFDLISLTSKLDRAEGAKAHRAFLLESGILILEDMYLENPGIFQHTLQNVLIAPLLIEQADGVPCTVIAF